MGMLHGVQASHEYGGDAQNAVSEIINKHQKMKKDRQVFSSDVQQRFQPTNGHLYSQEHARGRHQRQKHSIADASDQASNDFHQQLPPSAVEDLNKQALTSNTRARNNDLNNGADFGYPYRTGDHSRQAGNQPGNLGQSQRHAR